jgi:hypothetical protein
MIDITLTRAFPVTNMLKAADIGSLIVANILNARYLFFDNY